MLFRRKEHPLAADYPSLSDYSYVAGNPVMFIDPTGMSVEGDYYSKDGTHLGSDGIDDNKVYTADSKNADGTFSNAQELLNPNGTSLGHDNFLKLSAKVINEDSSPDGSKAVASAIYNYISAKNKTGAYYIGSGQSYASSTFKSGANKQRAYSAVINAFTGGEDLSRGAIYWDGRDVLTGGTGHYRYRKEAFGDRQGIFIPGSVESEVRGFLLTTLAYYAGHGNRSYFIKAYQGRMHTEGLHTGIKLQQSGSLCTVTAAVGSSIFYSQTPRDPQPELFNYVEVPITGVEFLDIWRNRPQ